MKTELLNIFGIAERIASIAESETKRSLSKEIVKLALYLQTGEPVYVEYYEEKEFVYVTMNKTDVIHELNDGYKLIMTIEKSKELNKFKVTEI